MHSNLKSNLLQQKADKWLGGFLRDSSTILHNDNVGLDVGFGLQNTGKIGKYNFQLVACYDFEKQRYKFTQKLLDPNVSLVDGVSNQHNALYKVSSNLNFIKITVKYKLS